MPVTTLAPTCNVGAPRRQRRELEERASRGRAAARSARGPGACRAAAVALDVALAPAGPHLGLLDIELGQLGQHRHAVGLVGLGAAVDDGGQDPHGGRVGGGSALPGGGRIDEPDHLAGTDPGGGEVVARLHPPPRLGLVRPLHRHHRHVGRAMPGNVSESRGWGWASSPVATTSRSRDRQGGAAGEERGGVAVGPEPEVQHVDRAAASASNAS